MRVMLKLVLDTDVDSAWRALRSPTVLQELYSPLMMLESLSPDGFPTVWEPGAYPVRVQAAGAIPIGKQIIDLSFIERRDGVRILHDSGSPETGPLSKLAGWDHQMAVSRVPGDPSKTLYRDRLIIKGSIAPLYWYPLWATWQWRGSRIKALAPTWAFDPPIPSGDDEDGTAG
ncbi:hypothetical protein [Plantibacter sp. YIM 135249]|uniref:hypothetical protein n=1 Tax=Plantibacter sp. YIM 135249 TaxID=3423918 RepID=UPI003D3529C6